MTRDYERDFSETVWEGCTHLDCYPMCHAPRYNEDGVELQGVCGRFVEAFQKWKRKELKREAKK